MGALTNKNFPFELRGWEIEKLTFFNPTDSFGNCLKILINNNKIIQIEPDYFSKNWEKSFICNKARYFFNNSIVFKPKHVLLKQLLCSLSKTIYLFELSRLKHKIQTFFFIIYENLGFDSLCLLTIFKQKYFFIKIYNVYSKRLNNNLEFDFLCNKINLKNSNFCLLINTDLKLESLNLNLRLKQRFLKGNFKILGLGSFFSLTFYLEILGNACKILKLLTEGVLFCCQTLKFSNNPILIFSSEFIKRKDFKFINSFLINLMTKIKNVNVNVLNSSIFETGIYCIDYFTGKSNLSLRYNSIYFLNILNFTCGVFTSILKINLVYLTKRNNLLLFKKYYINQNTSLTSQLHINFKDCFYLPTKTIFETSELFFNNEGLIKTSLPLFFNKKLKSNWKLLRFIYNNFNNKLLFLNTNSLLMPSFKNRHFFIKIIFLLYLAKKLISVNYILSYSNSFFINYTKNIFVTKIIKLFNTKLKLWLNDFYVEGKDNFTRNSLVLIKCSNMKRLQQTNFFKIYSSIWLEQFVHNKFVIGSNPIRFI